MLLIINPISDMLTKVYIHSFICTVHPSIPPSLPFIPPSLPPYTLLLIPYPCASIPIPHSPFPIPYPPFHIPYPPSTIYHSSSPISPPPLSSTCPLSTSLQTIKLHTSKDSKPNTPKILNPINIPTHIQSLILISTHYPYSSSIPNLHLLLILFLISQRLK